LTCCCRLFPANSGVGTGEPAINKLIISLLVLGAIACGAVYVVLYSGPAVVKRADHLAPTRTLAYEQKIARTGPSTELPDGAKPEEHAVAPADEASAPAAPGAAVAEPQAAVPDEGTAPSEPDDQAALPADEGAGVNDPDALPWQRTARANHPAEPGMGPDETEPWAEQEGRHDDPSDPMAAAPEHDDPNAWPAEPQDEPQEWVQVLVSGAGMHAAASEDAPALFAFPYGRTLRVVSRYQGWVEVTDPQSAATGWMKAQYLAPTAAPGTRQEVEQMQEAERMYDDDMPRWRRRWLRRHGGALGDLIGRAIGDY
jgi:hypothetical protein